MSGEWSGVMGDVITGKYAIGLSSWALFSERFKVLDLSVIFERDRMVLSMIPRYPAIDVQMFLKPFKDNVWFIITILCIMLLFLFNIMSGRFEKKRPYVKVIAVSMWLTFVLMNAYYNGALVSFFATEETIRVNSLEEVIKNVPYWNLVFLTNQEDFLRTSVLRVSKFL